MKVVVGHDELGREVVSTPSGLEQFDLEEILRHRYLGVFGDAPKHHFLGGSGDITFGGNDGEIGKRWQRLLVRSQPRGVRRWQDAYREIGRICSWLNLPSYIRDETTRIYANLRAQKATVKAGISIEKQLSKIAWLACLIHRYPRPKTEINSRLKELYGHGIGWKIPKEFVKAANFKQIRFGTDSKNGRRYLQVWEMTNGIRTNFKELGQL